MPPDTPNPASAGAQAELGGSSDCWAAIGPRDTGKFPKRQIRHGASHLRLVPPPPPPRPRRRLEVRISAGDTGAPHCLSRLLVGPMSDEATWAPMKPLVCELSARRIAQIWFNHANDLGKSFGDKTREWEMDTVAKLSKIEGEESAFQLEFTKARLRTPKTAGQFEPVIVRPGDDWRTTATSPSTGRNKSDVAIITRELATVYDFLADGVPTSHGLDGKSPVRKVKTAAIREELANRGYLEKDDLGAFLNVTRQHFSRAKKALLSRGNFIERKGLFWRK